MWSFAVPLLLAKMFSSLLPSSLFATISQLACVVCGGYVGHWIDRTNRIWMQQTALIVQNVCVVLSFILLIILEATYISTEKIVPKWGDARFVALFLGAIFFGSISAVASMITGISITKEWIVIIQKAHPYMALPNVNAMFRRIDLACKLLAPVAFALVLQFAGLTRSLILVTAWNALSLIPESFLTQLIYRRIPELSIPKVNSEQREIKSNPLSQVFSGWKAYFEQPIFRSSLAYVLLYFTVLSPGGVMTAYLEFANMGEILIALFTGFGALVGLAATFATPPLIEKFSLRRVGLYSLAAQMVALLPCVLPFVFSGALPIWLLPTAVALSRFGLWAFDLVEVQLMQTYVKDEKRGEISSVEYSLCNLLSVGAYAMGIVVPNPADFWILVVVSLICVAIALVVYVSWYLSPPREIFAIENAISDPSIASGTSLALPMSNNVELELEEMDDRK